MDRLKDKVAIVFGAGPNIGGTTAHFLAREGARVCVTDVREDAASGTAQFIRERGWEAVAMVGDARNDADVQRIVAATVEKYGRLDIVVNMAGRVHWADVLDMQLDDWQDSVASFATAGMLTTQHSARAMLACGSRGSIIHLLSTAAHFGEADGAAYCAAKAALLEFCPLCRHGPGASRHSRQYRHALLDGAPAVDDDARRNVRPRLDAARTPGLLLAPGVSGPAAIAPFPARSRPGHGRPCSSLPMNRRA